MVVATNSTGTDMTLFELLFDLFPAIGLRGKKKQGKHLSECRTESKEKRWATPDLKQPPWKLLQDVLRAQAESVPAKQLFLYPVGSNALSRPRQISYSELYAEAKQNSQRLARLPQFACRRPVLLHLEDQWDAILWFWTVLLAHGISVMSSPLSNVEEHRAKHLQGLSQLLGSPICITRATSLYLFENGHHTLQLYTVESLLEAGTETEVLDPPAAGQHCHTRRCCGDGDADAICNHADPEEAAVFMLTSGSTGNAKVVRLRHSQILAAVVGKMALRRLPADGAFLNWIALDHVASLIETHIPALCLGCDQVQVHPADVVASPQFFLDLLSRHRVARSFAPNFFLAKLVAANPQPTTSTPWDLSNLVALISGGEANDINTCTAAAALLGRHGAPPNVIQPGFGMTETCAGCIYSLNCPAYDLEQDRAIASLGRGMPGVEMRVVGASAPGEPGDLEVRGAVVFDGYYGNEAATAEAFPSGDGWFRTGDRAVIDAGGNLGLIGRAQDVININGVKIVTADMQAALETVLRATASVGRVVCFPSRAPDAATEQITVACVPREWPIPDEDAADVDRRVVQACAMVSTAGRPVVFTVSQSSLPFIPTSALGKISGAKMRTMFEAGTFDDDTARHRQTVEAFRHRSKQHAVADTIPATAEEDRLRTDFAETKGLNTNLVGLDTPLFELGYTSMDLIRLKHRIGCRLGRTVAIIVLMKNPTVRSLAAILENMNDKPGQASTSPVDDVGETDDVNEGLRSDAEYDPVVVLQSAGNKTPLWLVHPGVGEVLVFMGLAEHLKDADRPVCALRARGFEPGQHHFTSITEAVDTYVTAVRRRQPRGPYAIAGYSFGAMLAFEMAKKIQDAGETVSFLASFNLPPHIKYRMQQLTWNMCLLHLGQFIGLIDDMTINDTVEHNAVYREASRTVALSHVLALADAERLRELGLDERAILRWADVAHSLQSLAVDYEPAGVVATFDVFHAEPLRAVAPSRDEWVRGQLSQWQHFCRTPPRLHRVEGGHYTMIGPEHVAGFAAALRAALEARGV
jgi:thioesterase domain-containing protein/acyl-CoA synthetase (AMP-forming)/AMP-acid ligase II